MPVRAAKADWLPGTTWLGFTPVDGSAKAFAERQSTIAKQANGGFVLEYVTLKFDDPNPGYESDARIVEERARHKAAAGRFLAVHRLRSTSLPLKRIVGDEEYNQIQNRWAKEGARHRWSVAFPIVESYSIVGHPLAKSVFDEESYRHLFHYSSGILRPLSDGDRSFLGDLEITRREVSTDWIDHEFDMLAASRSQIPADISKLIGRDLQYSAIEGLTTQQLADMKTRNAFLANKFVKLRSNDGLLTCDNCGFDPAKYVADSGVKPRSLLDVHHKHPLGLGPRKTVLADFALLCPTCHRMEHAVLRLQARA